MRLFGVGTMGALVLAACAPKPEVTKEATVEEAPTKPEVDEAPTAEVEPSPTPGRKAAAGRKIQLELFEVWGGGLFDKWVQTAEICEEKNPDVGVTVTFSPGHGDNSKLLTALAGGVPPDMAMIVDFSTAQWVELGVMTDLTPYFEAAGL